MPPLIAAAAGVAAGAAVVSTGAAVATAVVVGTAAAVITHESGAADFVYEEIAKPVVKGIGDVIKYAVDNPIETIAKVAAVATGQMWAIPLIDGAKTLAQGGNLGDALKAAAISYVGGKLGNVAGKYVSTGLRQAGVNATVANIVGAVLRVPQRRSSTGRTPSRLSRPVGLTRR